MIDEKYLGYKVLHLADEEIEDLYYGKYQIDCSDLYENQYVVIEDSSNKIIDKYIYEDGKLKKLTYHQIENRWQGKIKPKNIEQELAIDMLQNNRSMVKLLTGTYGVGKDFLMINEAISRLERDDFDKLIWVRNNIEVRGVEKLGALPGDVQDKIINFAMPLVDHLGGMEGLQRFIELGRIEVAHLGYMRGRDIKNSLIYVSEAENLTTKLCQVLISRLSEGSQLWMNGDWRQSDRDIFEKDSGLIKMIERLTGQELFGHVHLTQSVRSKAASLADLLDD